MAEREKCEGTQKKGSRREEVHINAMWLLSSVAIAEKSADTSKNAQRREAFSVGWNCFVKAGKLSKRQRMHTGEKCGN